jgi:polysaccharide biosynthesis/export protein
MIRTHAITMVFSIIVLFLSGCFSSHPEDIEAFVMPDKANTTSEKYILQPPDEVKVYCTKIPEIDKQAQRIRPDGKVSFESIGELQAAGKTPSQLAADIRVKVLELYKAELIGENSIDLRIEAFQSMKYYVLGQVNNAGPRIYTGRDTVLTAISVAQPNPMAWVERIQIIRPSSEEGVKPYIFEINYDRMIAHGDTTKNVLLQEGDIIYVPPTILAWVALRIEEVLRPVARAFSLVYYVNTDTTRSSYNPYNY